MPRVLAFASSLGFVLVAGAPTAAAQSVWSQLQPLASPPPTRGHGMAFDAVRGEAVLFGGAQTSTSVDETWVFNGVNWLRRFPAAHPSARSRAAMCFDSVRQRVVLVGGDSNNNDTWLWDGVNWTQAAAAGLVQGEYSIAFDVLRGVTVAYTGNRTYEWSGAGPWLQRTPAVSPIGNPGAMAYDVAAARTVLFAGSQTWTWDGTAWLQRAPATSPPQRTLHSMAWDAAAGKIVLFGGYDSVELNDTWTWDGTDWTQQIAAGAPPGRHSSPLVYDPVRQRVMFFGGWPGLADTWIKNPTFGAPATVTAFGSGCAGSAGVPQLGAAPGSLPWIGSSLALDFTAMPPLIFRAPFGVLGISNTVWGGQTLPVALAGSGMPGCTAFVSVDQITALTNNFGTARWTIPIPLAPTLVGGHFYGQGLVVEPAANAFGAIVTNGVDLVIGAR